MYGARDDDGPDLPPRFFWCVVTKQGCLEGFDNAEGFSRFSDAVWESQSGKSRGKYLGMIDVEELLENPRHRDLPAAVSIRVQNESISVKGRMFLSLSTRHINSIQIEMIQLLTTFCLVVRHFGGRGVHARRHHVSGEKSESQVRRALAARGNRRFPPRPQSMYTFNVSEVSLNLLNYFQVTDETIVTVT